MLSRKVHVVHCRSKVRMADGFLNNRRALLLGQPGRDPPVSQVVLNEPIRQFCLHASRSESPAHRSDAITRFGVPAPSLMVEHLP